jgi:hypothetical protein
LASTNATDFLALVMRRLGWISLYKVTGMSPPMMQHSQH